MSSTTRRPIIPVLIVRVLVVLVALLASTLVSLPAAQAAKGGGERIVKIAASKRGTPYRYGATGPRAFDCSGFTRWVYARAGRHIPRTSRAQAAAARPVRRSDRRRGDLVFFRNGGGVYHVAIYAGRNQVWHSPHSGSRVHKARLWTNRVSYGRFR